MSERFTQYSVTFRISNCTCNLVLVYIVVAGLPLVGGGVVVNDETDRVWSEALLLLHVAIAISN